MYGVQEHVSLEAKYAWQNPRTREAYVRSLGAFLRWWGWKKLTLADFASKCTAFPKIHDANGRELLGVSAAMRNRTDLPPIPVNLDAGVIYVP